MGMLLARRKWHGMKGREAGILQSGENEHYIYLTFRSV